MCPTRDRNLAAWKTKKLRAKLAEQRGQEAKTQDLEGRSKITLENLFARWKRRKADPQSGGQGRHPGSVEAIVEALKKIESDKVSLEIIHSAVGTITENDVALASACAASSRFHTRGQHR